MFLYSLLDILSPDDLSISVKESMWQYCDVILE